MSEIVLTTENFDREVLQSPVPVLVDFWATWCPPCKVMGPVVDALIEELQGARVGKLNVDDAPEIAQRYGILSIPTFITFKGGEPVKQASGAMAKENLLALIQPFIG
ncbi:thioredoxin [Candidatus Uhrbacteria bacterium]|nr:thioredoxin [Candidatus Uhrbacteria bacterium]